MAREDTAMCYKILFLRQGPILAIQHPRTSLCYMAKVDFFWKFIFLDFDLLFTCQCQYIHQYNSSHIQIYLGLDKYETDNNEYQLCTDNDLYI